MKKSKKVCLLILIVMLVIAFIYVCGFLLGIFHIPSFMANLFIDETTENDIQKAARVIQENFDTDIVICGEEIKFKEEVVLSYVDEITNELVENEGQYKVIVINDLDSSVRLSDSEQLLLHDFIKEEGNVLIYLGVQYKECFDEEDMPIANSDDNLAYMYYTLEGYPRRVIGVWTQEEQDMLAEYPYILGNSILYAIEDYIIEMN